MKSALDRLINYLIKAGLDEIEACSLIAQFLEEESADYIALKNNEIEISDEELIKIKELVEASTKKLS